MKRRDVTRALGGLVLGAVGGFGAPVLRAQDVPIEVQDYVRLAQEVPVVLPPDRRLEVAEFFWYECPHCNAFEPVLEPWVERLPADVLFRRVPVGFTPRHELTQRLFYALEMMDRIEGPASLHAKVFDAIHNRWRRPDSERRWADFVASQGADRERFVALFRSDAVSARVREANRWADAVEVDSVPTLVVQGRYATSPTQAGGRERALRVAEHLMGLARAAA